MKPATIKVEYNDNFKFFLEHQVYVARTRDSRMIKFCSRLESKVLGTINDASSSVRNEPSDKEIRAELKKVHNQMRKDGLLVKF